MQEVNVDSLAVWLAEKVFNDLDTSRYEQEQRIKERFQVTSNEEAPAGEGVQFDHV